MGLCKLPIFVRAADFAKHLSLKKEKGQQIVYNEELERFLGMPTSSNHKLDYKLDLSGGKSLFGQNLNSELRNCLSEGRAVVVIDGLDEVPTKTYDKRPWSEELRRDLWELRRDVIRCVNSFVAQHVNQSSEKNSGTAQSFSGNQIVITSRISGYSRAPVQFENVAVIHARVRPMELISIRHFCHKWMRAAHGLESIELSISNYYTEGEEKSDDNIELDESSKKRLKDADLSAERFFRQITDRKYPQRYVMASNPLLLTIMALMYKSLGSDKLPSSRSGLFEKITQSLIVEEWQSKEWESLLPESQRTVYWDVLCAVAGFILNDASWGDYIDRDNLKRIMCEYFRPDPMGHETMRRIDRMIQHFEIRPGLLVQKSPDYFGFVHKSFLEFFGGLSELAWRESERSPETRVEVAVELITERYWQPKWKEPILHGLACAGRSSKKWPKIFLNELLSKLIDYATGHMNPSAHGRFQIFCYIVSAMAEWSSSCVEKRVLLHLISSLFRYCSAVLERSRVINHIELAFRAIKDFNRGILIEEFKELLTKDCKKTRCHCAILLDRLDLLDGDFERILRRSLSFDMEELGWPIHAILRLLASCDVGLGALPGRIPDPEVVQEDIASLEDLSPPAFKSEKRVLECLMKNETTTLNDKFEKLRADFRHHWNKISLSSIKKDSLASLSDFTFRYTLGGNRFAKDLVLKLRYGVMTRDLYESLNHLREMSAEGVGEKPNLSLLQALKCFASLFRGIIESDVTALSQVKKQVVELSGLKRMYSEYVVDTFGDKVKPPTPKLSDIVRKNATYDVASVVAVFSLGSLLQLSSATLGLSFLRGTAISYCLVRSLVVEEGLKTLLIQDRNTAAKLRFCSRYLDMEEGVAKAVVDHVSRLRPMMLKSFVPALVDSCLIRNCNQLDKKERLLQREPLSNLMSLPEIEKVKEDVKKLPKIKEDFDSICLRINQKCALFATCHFQAQTPRRVECGFADDDAGANLQMIRRARQNSTFCRIVIALHGGTHYLGLKDFTEEYEHIQFLDRLSHTKLQQCLELHVLSESFPLFTLKRRIAQTSGCSRVRAKKLAVLRQAKPVIRSDCIFTDRSGISDRLTKPKSDVEMEDMLESFKNELSTDATKLEESKALALCLTVSGSCEVVAKLLRSEVPMHRFRNEIADVLSERLHTLSDATCRAQIHFVQLPCVKRIIQSSLGAQFCLEFVKLYTDLGGKPDTKLLSGLEDEGSPEDVRIVVRALILGFHLSIKEFRSDSDEEYFQILPELRTPTDESKLRVCNILDCLSFCSTMDWWARRNTIVLPFFRRLTEPNICFAQEMKEAYSLDLLETLEAIAVCLPSFALVVIEFLKPRDTSGICGLFWRTMHFVIQMRVNPRKEGLKAVEEKTELRARCQKFASSETFASGQVLIALLKFFPCDVAEMQNKISDFATTLSTSSSLKAFQLLWWCLSSPYSRCRKTIADKAESYGSTIECSQKRALALCRLSIYCCSSQKTLELLNTSLKTITELARSTMAAELRQCVPELYFIISAVALKENGAVNLANRFWDFVLYLGGNLIGSQSFALEQAKTLIEQEAEKDDSIGILFNLILLTSRTRDTLLAGCCCLHLAGNEDKYWFAFQNGIGVTAQSARHKLRKRLRQGFLDLSVPVALVLKAMLKSERRMEAAEFFPHLRIVSKEVMTLIEAWLEDDILCSVEIMQNVMVKDAVLLLISECHGLTERSLDCILKFLKCENDVFRMRAEGVLTESQVYCTSSSSIHFLRKIALFVEDARKSENRRIAYLAQKLLYSIHHDDASVWSELLKSVSHKLEETVVTNLLIEGMYSASAEVWKELEKLLGELESTTNSEGLQKSIFLSLCSLCHGFRLQGFNDTSKFYQHFSSCVRFFANGAYAEELLKGIQCFRSNPLAILRIHKEGDSKYDDVRKWLRINLQDLLQTLSNDTIGAEYKFLDADLLCERSSAYNVLYCLSNAADDWRSERIRNIMENVVSLQWRDWELEMDSIEIVESEIELDPSFSTRSTTIRKLEMLCSSLLKKWKRNQTEFKNTIAGLLCDVVICLAGVLGAATSDKPSSKSFSDLNGSFLVRFASQRSPLVQYAVLVIIANLNFTELDDDVVRLTCHLLQYPGSLTRCQILEKIRRLHGIVEEKESAVEKQLQFGSATECVVACCLIAMMTKFSNMNSDILKRLMEKLKAVLQNRTIYQQPVYPFWIDSKAGKFPLVEDLILETLTNISGSVFEAVPFLPYKLGEPDSKGIFVHEETSMTPIWYKYSYEKKEWLWTPYEPAEKRVWMPASTDIVQGGKLQSYAPSLENRELIRCLQSCPPPSSSGALGHLLT